MGLEEKLNMSLLEEDEDEDQEDIQEGKFLTFVINREEFGFEIRYVTQIIGIHNITEVPDMPEYVRGVINLRGKVIPVMDVRIRFGITPKEYDDRTCIVVINVKEQVIGLIVDTVSEVMDIPKDQIDPTPHLHRDRGNRFILGMGKVGDKVKILLDVEKLLWDED